jgi:hypothetical protein
VNSKSFASAILSGWIVLVCSLSLGAEFYVAPKGKDSNPGTRQQPFASFAQAQRAVRAERTTHPEGAVSVIFKAGMYALTDTLRFTGLDSGATAEKPVRYEAEPGFYWARKNLVTKPLSLRYATSVVSRVCSGGQNAS